MVNKDKDRLVVAEGPDGAYGITWWLPEDDDYGATVGEDRDLPSWEDFREKMGDLSLEDARLWYECESIARLELADGDAWRSGHTFGFWWDSKSRAQKVLREAKARTKFDSDRI